MAPDTAPKGKSLLVAEVTYSAGDSIDTLSDEEFLQRITEDLATVGLVKPGSIDWTLSHKEPFVYPIQTTGYQEKLIKTRSVLNRYSQLYSLGTGGDFNYADSQILFQMAFDTVATICGKDSSFAQAIREITPVRQNDVVEVAGQK